MFVFLFISVYDPLNFKDCLTLFNMTTGWGVWVGVQFEMLVKLFYPLVMLVKVRIKQRPLDIFSQVNNTFYVLGTVGVIDSLIIRPRGLTSSGQAII